MAERSLRVGVAQMDPILGDVEANLDIVERFVDEAEERGVDLLVFPELALTGYPLGDWFPDVTLRPDSPHTRRLRALSTRVAIVVGFIEETEDVDFYNSAMYLANGEIHHIHRKIYLPNYRIFNDKRHFGAGAEVRAFDTPWGRIAMLVCADCWHLSIPYLAVHDGADILVVLAASSREGLSHTVACDAAWDRMNRSYALTLSTFMVFANFAGEEEGLHFWGGSHVVLPDGNVQARAPMDVPTLLVADLDLGFLRRQRLVLPFRRDDSLRLTLDLGSEILQAKTERSNGFRTRLTSRKPVYPGPPRDRPGSPSEPPPSARPVPER